MILVHVTCRIDFWSWSGTHTKCIPVTNKSITDCAGDAVLEVVRKGFGVMSAMSMGKKFGDLLYAGLHTFWS